MVGAYNRSRHGTTGVAPIDVDNRNAEEIFIRVYEPDELPPRETRTLYVGDTVRISKARRSFERGYTPNWTTEVFVITERRDWTRPVSYTIKDLNDEAVEGTFYEAELQRVEQPETFIIEKIIRRRGRGRRLEYFVKWSGYPDSFNSWVLASDFV